MLDGLPRRFATTRWTLVRAVRGRGSDEARDALAVLCRTYWWPVHAFMCRSGASDDDARDLTQAFFAKVIEKGAFEQAREDRGKFRTFLLSSARNFLSNEREAAHAQKRGSGREPLPLEFDDGDGPRAIEPAGGETPERAYERKWALEVIALSLKVVESRYEASGRRALFVALQPFLTGDEPSSYGDVAGRLGTTDGALRVAAHRLRRDFAAVLRETIADTVERPEDVDDELRYLLRAVGP